MSTGWQGEAWGEHGFCMAEVCRGLMRHAARWNGLGLHVHGMTLHDM